MKLGDTAVYDHEHLYVRMLIVLQKRDLNLKDVFSHELCPVPSALFDDYGDMRKSSEAALVSKVAKFCEKPPAAVSCTNYCKCREDTQCQNAHSNDDDADNDDDAEIKDDSSESDDESDAQDLV